MIYKFTTIINKEAKWFVARCVELGVVSQGKTIESAQENLKEAVELYLEDMPKAKKYSAKSPAFISTLEVANG
ncbi:MAG: type II toxin-antitoxin system HicB family antitoxin [Candidatus Doudnabacteria bacterium]|nr:type II toxin-antitoxin system HicB family antitoxin [Candidatus Doudnabacteria bacterium]